MTREGISVGSRIAVSLRSLAAGIYDEVRGLVGLSPHYIAVFGRPGQVAAFTDPEWESHLAVLAKAQPGETSSPRASSSALRKCGYTAQPSAFECRCSYASPSKTPRPTPS